MAHKAAAHGACSETQRRIEIGAAARLAPSENEGAEPEPQCPPRIARTALEQIEHSSARRLQRDTAQNQKSRSARSA
jgi:hypothetical protein